MAQSITLSESEMNILREEAILRGRSIDDQALHWQRIGRAIERSGSFNYNRIHEALNGRINPDVLSRVEQEVFFEAFADAMMTPTPEQEAFFAALKSDGVSVGLDENGNLIYSKK